MIVFDEADKLLELGFEAEIKQIMGMINQEVQTILFSATMGQEIKKLTLATTRKPLRVSADPDNVINIANLENRRETPPTSRQT